MNNFILSAAINFDSVSLPFSVIDLVSSGSQLILIVGAFIILGLAFPVCKKLIESIHTSFIGAKAGGYHRDFTKSQLASYYVKSTASAFFTRKNDKNGIWYDEYYEREKKLMVSGRNARRRY